MKKRFKLGDKHPMHKKLQKVWDALEKQGIMLDFLRDGTVLVVDMKSKESFELNDSDDGGGVGSLPPTFEYKLVFERDVP